MLVVEEQKKSIVVQETSCYEALKLIRIVTINKMFYLVMKITTETHFLLKLLSFEKQGPDEGQRCVLKGT